MSRRLICVAVLLLVSPACGGGTAAESTTTTAPPTTVTIPPTTTSEAATTTPTQPPITTTVASSTTAPVPFFSVAGYGMFPDPLLTPADGHGSGCAPPGDVLPAGMWFGFARAVSSGDLTFDLACFFTGDAAVAAATADGEEAIDFYIRNKNPKLFTVPLDPTGTAYWLDATASDITPLPIAMGDWPVGGGYTPCPGEYCPVWLFVNDGEVTELLEQYLP